MLDQAEQVRAGRRHRPPDVVVGQSLQLPRKDPAYVAQIPMQGLLLIGSGHGASLAQAHELVQRVSASAALIRQCGELVKQRRRSVASRNVTPLVAGETPDRRFRAL
jgi:hypothetical protein